MDRTSGRSSLVHGDPYLILRWWGKAHEFYAVQREQGREKPNLFLLSTFVYYFLTQDISLITCLDSS